ncbi:histone-lysine N-methyltransferase NSD2-like isoform X2 [Adelges cooleyi]|uniref:histone-lysine N-methyltransferase NSD2-like isoform X2 n=1 Tax=Adelges cooleyi TaxID=133065 RepID=UPI00217FC313|nr:histone-lysine N-methyltransferase NSD2-like isoform X2 [Adelges cooleyi]
MKMADLDSQDDVSTELAHIDEVHPDPELNGYDDRPTLDRVSPHQKSCENNSFLVAEIETLNNTVDDVTMEPLYISEQTNDTEGYKIGDIVWAKIGRYPFWPSVICVDPSSKIHYKECTGFKKSVCIHVRFCNDHGRRSWVRTIEKYFGKDALLTKHPSCTASIKYNKKVMETWNSAVKEADFLMTLNVDTRMVEFFKTFNETPSDGSTNKSSPEKTAEPSVAGKIRTYSRKRSQTIVVDHESIKKIIKTENLTTNHTNASKSIDIPIYMRSDDVDSTISNLSMSYEYNEKIDTVFMNGIPKKTYPPKHLINEKSLSDSDPDVDKKDNSDNTSILFFRSGINDDNIIVTKSTRKVPESLKKRIKLLEDIKDVNEKYSNTTTSPFAAKKNVKSKSTNLYDNDCSNEVNQSMKSSPFSQKKSNLIEKESSSEPETTESETSSRNDNYSSVFLANQTNRELFVKTLKKACIVCENYQNTIRCTGTCQNYFHKECFAKSGEKSSCQNQPTKAIKKPKYSVRSKRRRSKSLKNKPKYTNSTLNNETIGQELAEEINDDINNVNDNSNCIDSTSETVSLSIKDGSSSSDQSKSDKLTEIVEQVNIQQPDSSESAYEETVFKTSEEKIEKMFNKPKKMSINGIKPVKHIDSEYMCNLCKANKVNCFSCGLNIDKDSEQKFFTCKLASCGKVYHENCLDEWPQCQWIQGFSNSKQAIVCPLHVCHLCISDNPKSKCKLKFPAEKLIRCIRCPTAYHRSEYCLPAGSQVLTYSNIVCSRHFVPAKGQVYHMNSDWCFICTLRGSLVCCDLCPSSFHLECLNLPRSKVEGGFTCEECQTGRYPLYGEIVWAKIATYRWWPAQIVFPNQIPDSVNAIPHSIGQFALQFFGTYDYYWLNRGRVFNFHEGDDENILVKNTTKNINQVFQDAIIEAAQAHNAYILDKDRYDAKEINDSLKNPPKYTKIKFNKPVGNVKMESNLITMTSCECDPTKPNPCGPGSDCLNRMLMFECQPRLCPAGDKCNNQRFEKTLYPSMEPFLTNDRGWGLRTLEDIKEGSFVIEYVGEVIDEEEFKNRCYEMQKQNEQNYYFLTIDHNRMIDAGPKGNLSRFMNHSCEPNCVTQKWTVNGDTRIGLFALQDIPASTELVFDYRLQSCSGVEKKPCQCGATRCSKYIGVKVDKEEEKKKTTLFNDADKSKASSKKQKSPKYKAESSDIEKSDDSIKSKIKPSSGKHSFTSKNENSDTSVTKIQWRKSTGSTNITKTDISSGSSNCIVTRRSLRNNPSAQCQRKHIEHCANQQNNGVMAKTRKTRKPLKSKKSPQKSNEVLDVFDSTELTETKAESSRHSLTRLAKSRHLVLSKKKSDDGNMKKKKIILETITKRKKKNVVITPIVDSSKIIKHKEISHKKKSIKKDQTNKRNLLSTNYFKNNTCLVCGKGHTELICKNKKCPRVFHLSCMNKSRIAKSGFICPSHYCSICKKRKVVAKCKFCVESFCAAHIKGNVFKDPLGNGMLCITHYPDKKHSSNRTNSLIVPEAVDKFKKLVEKSENVAAHCATVPIAEVAFPLNNLTNDDSLEELELDTNDEKDYMLTQVIKDESDREYIHIGGFNVSNISDLVVGKESNFVTPTNTDGDMFKPSSTNVVIDIESASALYHPTDSLGLVSIAGEHKDNHDYVNVQYVPETKTKWIADAEP